METMDTTATQLFIGIISVIFTTYLLFLLFALYKKPELRGIILYNQMHVIIWVALMFPLMLTILFNWHVLIPDEWIAIWIYCGILQMAISKLFTFLVKWLDWRKGKISC